MEQDDAGTVRVRIVLFDREVEILRCHALRPDNLDPRTGVRHLNADAEVALHIDRQVAALHTELIHAVTDNDLRLGRRLADRDRFHNALCLVGEDNNPFPAGERLVLLNDKIEGQDAQCLGRHRLNPRTTVRDGDRQAEIALDLNGKASAFRIDFIQTASDNQLRSIAFLKDGDGFRDAQRFIVEQNNTGTIRIRIVFFNRKVERLRRHSLRRHIFDPGTAVRHFDADAEIAGHIDRQVAAFHTEFIHALADEQLRNGRRLTDDDLLFHIQGRCLEAEFTTPLGEGLVLIDGQGEGTG